ncbi:MAG: restriction endonuclease, partial [Cyanobacteria bacterium P01_E01_bin.42]
MPKAIQKILFGSPGTGKSYKVREIAQKDLDIQEDDNSKLLENTVKTIFHPEYTYGDFMGKLLPSTVGNNVIYKFYPGHFLKVLGFAYKSLIEGTNKHCLLVIDELNRGNASAIFGTVFQLLDREDDGWSSYEVDISEMELYALLRCIFGDCIILDISGIKVERNDNSSIAINTFLAKEINEANQRISDWVDQPEEEKERYLDPHQIENGLREDFEIESKLIGLLSNKKIKIPPNLSIIATINTSDESIYYLDSAFKRRWDWEYIEA